MKKKGSSPKERILNTSIRLFYNQGYNATGINQIILESQVAKASFYEAFSSKDELGKAVLRRYQADIIRWMREILSRSETPDRFVKNFIKAVLNQIKDEVGVYNGCPVALFSAQFPSSNHQFRKEFIGSTERWEKLISNHLEKFKKNGLLKKNTDTGSLTRKILNLYEGSLVMWRLSLNTVYMKELSNQLIDVMETVKA
jgi:AcrR family transcriptional regulator